ncbi:zinc finger, C3HC4 type (RING finger) protein (macronuclear) [Tetrahymena thermophila SB210]|uniref:Zinc finger, C3HC4 type (RING finger) protein n=1 Tax=Tetrahymena thermophila (strain SB210) TaxID=312017 RepID=I7LXF1_TETTS|nr:zinc finger, C3HC4 type (RING finger) protein [Tetrahymena thermophila SB210]EAS04519.2 zinc finger, C3HC4 type (RING finger) protein [Tetrahymena thermophila SB210]|eukprot:XP_001024764.2 zinc finger, C3HC4 type (RING finger) protein [Tetrahymena thermophila SB210]
MKLIDLPSIQKIRSEINSARLEQMQQKEDISEQSTAKGEKQKSNRQQIHQFRKHECNLYLKSCQSSFREKETEKEIISSLTNQKSIECIQIENIQPPNYEQTTCQNQDQQNIISVENANQQADKKITEEQQNPNNQEQKTEIKQESNKTSTPQNQQIKEEEEQNCLICFQNSQDSVFMNCGHGGICYDCSLDIWKITGECYLCREKIKQILQIDLQYKKQKNLVKILYITELTEESESESDSEQSD